MEITKNKILDALEFFGEYPKKSQKKERLEKRLNEIYDNEIERLIDIVSIEIYNLLEKMLNAKDYEISVDISKFPEAKFLESILLIEEPVWENDKLYIELNIEMKDRISKFINIKNKDAIKKNQKIVDLFINILEVYGIVEENIMFNMLNKFLQFKVEEDKIWTLINYQIELRSLVEIAENEETIYFINNIVEEPEKIIEEREKRHLTYKEFTLEELKKNTVKNLLNKKESQETLEFLKHQKVKFPEAVVMYTVRTIMSMPDLDINNFKNIFKIDFDNIEEANEYLQLVMNLHNNIPHYNLCGYSPMDLVKIQEEQLKKEELDRKNKKVGRNDPCICGSGKKYKNCCLNKVIQVDFAQKQYPDCLEEEEARLFFSIKNSLLYYVNEKYKINSKLEDFQDIVEAEPEDVMEIRKKLWSNTNIIKEFIKENQVSEELANILKEWNEKKLDKNFILYKYEKEYAVFIDDDNIYYVKGLKETIRNLIPENRLPMFVNAVLLPYRGKIIYDSYLNQYNMAFGEGLRKIWNENYKKMLKENKVKYEL